MNFANPAFLWAAAALAPLVAIYLLRVRPRRHPTTALFLWQSLLTRRQTSSLFQRLRQLWSLLLMALAVLALAAAAAGPRLGEDERRDLLIVVDTSASMATEAEDGRRIDRAKDAARDLVRALSGEQRAAIATLAGDLDHVSHLTTSRRDLLAAIDRIEVGTGRCDPQRLDHLVASDGPWAERYRTLLVSDGCDLPDQLPTGIELWPITDRARNVGLVAADMRRLPDGRVALFYQLASTHDEPVERELQLAHDTEAGIRRLIPVTVEPGVNPAEVFHLEQAESGAWFLSLDRGDAFALDDRAYLALRPRQPVPVRIDAEAPYFLARCIQAFERSGDLVRLAEDGAGDLVLAHGTDPTAPRAMILQPSGESRWWNSIGDELGRVVPEAPDRDHPLLAHLDPDLLPFVGARELRAPEGAEIVLRDAESGVPLLYRVRREGRQAVVVNLDPLAGEFYLSTTFPVLVHDTARLLIGREAERAGSHPAGAPLVLGESVEHLEDPSGTRLDPVTGLRPTRLGHYRVHRAGGIEALGVSLLSMSESTGEPGGSEAQPPTIERGHPLSTWLILLAIALLVGESILYHRRMAG